MGWCYGFEPPGLRLVPPYEIRDAVEQEYFCPIVEADTIRWELADEVLPPGDPASVEAAAAIHRRSVALLDRAGERGERWWAWALGGVVALAASIYMRSAGILVLPAMLLLGKRDKESQTVERLELQPSTTG